MAANHKVSDSGTLDGNRTQSEDGITLKQKDKKHIIPYL